MKSLLKHLWFLLFIRKGSLVFANTVPIMMNDTVLAESKKVIGIYKYKHKKSSWCYITGSDDRPYQVYVKSIKKVNATKNPELFI